MKMRSTATPTVRVRSRSRLAVSFTGISSGKRDDRHAGLAVVGDEAVERLGLRGDRADPGDVRERPRCLEEADAVAGRGRVDDHEVVRLRRP